MQLVNNSGLKVIQLGTNVITRSRPCHHPVIISGIPVDQIRHHLNNRCVISRHHTAMSGKGNPLLSVRLPLNLDQLLNTTAQQTGESRSEIAIAALTAYLLPSSDHELAQLKRRVEALERRLSV